MKLDQLNISDDVVSELIPTPTNGQQATIDPADPGAQRKMMAQQAADRQEKRRATQEAIKLKQEELRRNQEELQNLRQQLAQLR